MITKFTLVNKYTILFEACIFLLSIYFMIFIKNLLLALGVIILYICIYIFLNSIVSHNIEKSVLSRLNLHQKHITQRIFTINCLLYFPCFFIFIIALLMGYDRIFVPMTIIIYQVFDFLLLKYKIYIHAYFITFLLFITLTYALFLGGMY